LSGFPKAKTQVYQGLERTNRTAAAAFLVQETDDFVHE
jgi:hypothetical protein